MDLNNKQMNEKQKIDYLIGRIDQATKAGVFSLQEATNCGIILRELAEKGFNNIEINGKELKKAVSKKKIEKPNKVN